MAYDDEPRADQTSEEALLAEIRETYRYFDERWQEWRKERATDMRYLAGDPWEPEDRDAREKANRPCISHDELTQYVNQAINNVRQNKRGIKVTPRGNGANDKTAEFRQNHIRAIEYKSKAQGAYVTAFENELEGSYGFIRIGRRFVSNDAKKKDASMFDQEITISAILNPDSVLYDPDCKEPDWSDARKVIVVDPMPKAEFKRQYPGAKVHDFGPEHMRVAKDWIQDKTVLVAEYWRIETRQTRLYLLASGEVVDELQTGQNAIKSRVVEQKKVMQYLTNGIEILERNEQPGEFIPIIPFIGKEMWVDQGGTSKRLLLSLIRLARDPQMSLAYLCSQQMEEAGLTPKTPYVGYKGQFDSDQEAWENLTKVPRAYVEVDAIPEGANGQILPLPRREPFTPNFQAYEVAKDSCRRAVQAAMGISPLPTAAQRNNEKSGIALQRIQGQQEIGSFHFLDKFNAALEFAGRVIDSWIPIVYDTEREITLRKPDDSHQLIKANTPAPYLDQATQQQVQYTVDAGDHDVTISTGPSAESQRDAASDFLDLLVSNLGQLPVAPPQAAKLLSIAIRMKQLGPLGDEMADIISPQQDGQQLPAQAQQAIQAQQMKLQQAGQLIQLLHAEIGKLQQEKQAKIIDNQFRMDIEKLKIDADLAKAEITTKAQMASERNEFVQDAWQQLHAQIHEGELQSADQQHQLNMADQEHQQTMQQGAQEHQQALDQAGMEHQAAMAQQQDQQQADAQQAEQQAQEPAAGPAE